MTFLSVGPRRVKVRPRSQRGYQGVDFEIQKITDIDKIFKISLIL